MNFNDILTAISTLGFPIFMCLLQYKLCNDTLKELSSAINELKIAIKGNDNNE